MNIPLFDAHCDTLSRMYYRERPMWKNDLHVDLYRYDRYAPRGQFFAIFGRINPTESESTPLDWTEGRACFDAQYAIFQDALAQNGGHIVHCRTARDAERAAADGKLAAFLAVEGAEILDCDPARLEEAHALGVRMVTLTWNYINGLSGTNAAGGGIGLTERGRAFVRRCQQLGVIVDLSHISEPGFWDVLEIAEKPVVASHSNAKALCDVSRNLTDAQFSALVKNGGVVGINLFSEFLGEGAGVDTVIAHIEHFLALGGERHIALGGDLDGCDSLPRGIDGIEDMEKIAERLLQKNCSEELVCDIFYNNLMRMVRELCVI